MEFGTIIYTCKKYVDGKIEIGEFIKFVESIKIKKYLSLMEKYFAIKLINIIKDNGNIDEHYIVNLEMISVFDILFLYIDGLEFDRSDRSIKSYDTLMQSGFIDILKKRIGSDYNRFMDMLYRSMDLKAIDILNSVLSNSEASKLIGITDEVNAWLQDEATMNAVNNILEFNNQKKGVVNGDKK